MAQVINLIQKVVLNICTLSIYFIEKNEQNINALSVLPAQVLKIFLRIEVD